jgi:hypothetical protein
VCETSAQKLMSRQVAKRRVTVTLNECPESALNKTHARRVLKARCCISHMISAIQLVYNRSGSPGFCRSHHLLITRITLMTAKQSNTAGQRVRSSFSFPFSYPYSRVKVSSTEHPLQPQQDGAHASARSFWDLCWLDINRHVICYVRRLLCVKILIQLLTARGIQTLPCITTRLLTRKTPIQYPFLSPPSEHCFKWCTGIPHNNG